MSEPPSLDPIPARLDQVVAESAFAGVVRIDPGEGGVPVERAYGLADRRWSIPMTPSTAMSIASGTKGFTALVVMALIEAGALGLETAARSLLGPDLPLIDDAVTVEQLLAHRSGIGDYLDEEQLGDIADHVVPIPIHRLDAAEAYLPILDGFEQVFAPDQRFTYNNSGYVVLALLAERTAGRPYADLVDELVTTPAGLRSTAFHRSDALPAEVATGYLDADVGDPSGEPARTNALHLPVVGVGDGGLFSTGADLRRFWTALFDGRIVSPEQVDEMTRPRSVCARGIPAPDRYGLGFWLAPIGPIVRLEGYDAGVSFLSWHDPTTGATCTVLSNTSEGAWPIARLIDPDGRAHAAAEVSPESSSAG